MRKAHITVLLTLIMIFALAITSFASYDKAFVRADILNVRSEMSTDSKIIDRVPYGYEFSVVNIFDDWVEVVSNVAPVAYVSKKYVTFSSDEVQAAPSVGEDVVAFAKNYLGTGYSYGSSSPSGFDCSGFVMYVFKQKLGISLDHSSRAMSLVGSEVSVNELKAGDLVFFSTYSTSGVGHVGIYISDGNFIHASSGKGRVCISNLSEDYYAKHYKWARRIL